jgi:uncharacterized protein YsxB (DUF464 family)
MVKVKFRTHDATRYLRLTVEGHAGSDDPGHDLVCAMASILAYTVAQMVQAMEHHGDLVGKPCINLNDGDATILIRCKNDDVYAEARHTFLVAETGYRLLAHNYPQYVELKSVGMAESA